MSAPVNQETAQQSAQTPQSDWKSSGAWGGFSPKFHCLKIGDSLLQLVASYSDHPLAKSS
jgi:hypothetical protein